MAAATTTRSTFVPLLALLAAGCGEASRAPAPPPPTTPVTVVGGPSAVVSAPAPAASAASGSVVTGSVGGHALAPRNAVFSWRAGADDMQIILSDADGLCDTLAAGAWPKDATVLMFTLKHTARATRDAPFGAGDYPLRSGAAIEPQDTKRAVWMRLDPACAPLSSDKATAGVVHLTTPEVEVGGTAAGSFELSFGDEQVKGRFDARFCPPPENEPHGCRP